MLSVPVLTIMLWKSKNSENRKLNELLKDPADDSNFAFTANKDNIFLYKTTE